MADSTVAVISPSRHHHHHGEIKEAKDSSNSVDLISTLPDVILQHILSFIPTRFVIRTSILSKRWKHVWSDTPSLNFDFCHTMKELNVDSINKTLTRYTPPKMMSFHLCTIVIEHTPHVNGWIKFVMSRNVEIMSLHLPDRNYNFPDFLYINFVMKELTFSLNYFHEMEIPINFSVSWTSLKKLTLCCCRLSCEYIDKILSGCSVLESLVLYNCTRPMMKVLDLSKSLCLRTLEMDYFICIVLEAEPIQIVAPYIHYLRLTNSELPCILVDVSSLTEARLEPSISLFEKPKIDLVLKLLEKLHNVEKLTFGANLLRLLSLDGLCCRVPNPSFKVKVLTLERIFEDGISGLVWLIQNSPELKKLTIHGPIPEECIDKLLGFARLEIISVNKGL